ncbi:hypothetical protein NDN08_005095 [Rhodosorus marinus]|uniref:Uncharacterized protein n=1 Tax=Rhodosorus marinus TaxID=101924 RepID=A0AAV8V387_9RHOD|nr:hypothetical protein NDN08_005095 [Rhodosorus marinus]
MAFVPGLKVGGLGETWTQSACVKRRYGVRIAGGRVGKLRMSGGFPPPSDGGGRRPGGGENGFLAALLLFIVGGARTVASPNGQLFLFGFVLYLFFSGNFIFVFNTLFTFFAVATLLPVLLMLVFRLYMSRNLIEGNCSNCGAPVAGIRNQSFQCTRCGTKLEAGRDGTISISDPSSATMDVSFREE